jgi:ubiquinone/menaquinone biosynthesis C-methylase UbiE
LANATLLPFGEERFDGLLASNLLEHLPDPELVFVEAQRVLASGGIFVLTVPLEAGYLHDATHASFIRESHVRNWAERHGLTVREAYFYPIPWKRIASMLYFCELRIVLCKNKSGM